MTSRCTKSITLTSVDGHTTTKVRFADRDVYALGAGRHLVRVRHRSDLPARLLDSGPLVLVLAKGTKLSVAQAASLTDCLEHGYAPRPFDTDQSSAELFFAPQAPRTTPSTTGFLNTTGLASSSSSGTLGEGGRGARRGPQSELFALLVNDRLSQSAYEDASTRQDRRAKLIKELVATSPDWLVDFTRSLRTEHNARSAALMLAVDATMAGHPRGHQLVDAALARPDEPALALRYFFDTYPGQSLPRAMRRGVAAAATRLYDEGAVVNFDRRRTRRIDGQPLADHEQPVTFADVLNLTHPKATSPEQSALFSYLRHGTLDAQALPRLAARQRLAKLSTKDKRSAVATAHVKAQAIFAKGYANRTRLDDDLASLSASDLLTWRPPTLERFIAQADVTARRQDVAAAITRLEAARDDAFGLLRPAATIAHRITSLEAHQHHDEIAHNRAETRLRQDPYDATALARHEELTRRIYERQARIDQLREEVSREQDACLPTALSRLAAAKKGVAATSDVPVEIAELALLAMGYKETITSLDLFDGVSPAAREFLFERLADQHAAANSSVQITDLVTAGTYLAYQAAKDEPIVSSRRDRAFAAPGLDALDHAAQALAASTLGDLGDKRVLVLVDGSGSMHSGVSTRRGDSRAQAYEGTTRSQLAAGFAGLIASAGTNVDVVSYSTQGVAVDLTQHSGVISAAMAISLAAEGGGTDTFGVLADTYAGHDIVVILTDEQTSWSPFTGEGPGTDRYDHATPRDFRLPEKTKIITCNLAGDEFAHAASHPNHLTIAGASLAVLEGLAAAVKGRAWEAGI
jgi:hypothetical protein